MKVSFEQFRSLFFRKRRTDEHRLVSFLLTVFHYRPKNLQLFIDALTHKSYSNTRENMKSNERLEFLGDTVIDLIVAEYLYERFPSEDEGYLTKIKAKIVNRKMLAFIGGEIELAQFIRYRKGRSIRISTIEGNALEALMGAIYMDSNFETAKLIFEKYIIKKYVNFKDVLSQEMDFKSSLLIWGQKNKIEIAFEIKEEAGKENNFTYTAVVVLKGKEWGMGKGRSKKEAEQQASNETMTLLGLH